MAPSSHNECNYAHTLDKVEKKYTLSVCLIYRGPHWLKWDHWLVSTDHKVDIVHPPCHRCEHKCTPRTIYNVTIASLWGFHPMQCIMRQLHRLHVIWRNLCPSRHPIGVQSSLISRSFLVQDAKGNNVALSFYKGKVLLIVHVASKWYTLLLLFFHFWLENKPLIEYNSNKLE